MKKLLTILLASAMAASVLAGCGGTTTEESPAAESSPAAQESAAAEEEAPPAAESTEKLYIAIVSKGFQHQFWQTVKMGSDQAAADLNVEITFDGPPSESDISTQVDQLNNALTKNPAAICLAALDTESVTAQLTEAQSKGIPVIGFDSGVPNAPEGSIYATASTNNYEAGRMGATEMFNQADFNAKLKAATADAPVVIACQSQDATSASVVERTTGFLDEMKAKAEELFPGAVEITGHDNYKVEATNPVVVSIKVTVPPSTQYTDLQAGAQTMLQNNENLIGYFCSNEAAVTGLLAATNDGTDLDRENGKYKDLIVVGFDAGSVQKNAVREKYFYGSVTQDPYQIGYLAVELAVKAINGETSDALIDTGCKFYTSENMDNEDIAPLLYD